MTFDKPEVGDLNEILDLLDECFIVTPRSYFEHFVLDKTSFPDLAIVVKDEGKVIGFVQILPRNVRSIDGTLRMGGVGNVAVKPEYRNRRIGSKLIEIVSGMLEDMKIDLSVLFAVKYRFYGRWDWFIIPRVNYKFELPEVEEDGGLEIIESSFEDHIEEILELQELFNERSPLTVVRDEYIWKFQVEYDERKVRLAMKNGRLLGYIVFEKIENSFRLLDTSYLFPWVLPYLLKGLKEIHFPGKPNHPVVEDLKRISKKVRISPSTDVYVKAINMSREELLFELGIGRNDTTWHFWELDKY